MALIQCKECSKEISDKAKSCPQCGAPTEFAEENSNFIQFILFGLIMLSTFGLAIHIMTRPDCITSAKQRFKYPDSVKVLSWDSKTKKLVVSARNLLGTRKIVEFKCLDDLAIEE